MSQCNQGQIARLIFTFLKHSTAQQRFLFNISGSLPMQEQPKHPRGAAQRQLSTNTAQSLAGTKSQHAAQCHHCPWAALQDSPCPRAATGTPRMPGPSCPSSRAKSAWRAKAASPSGKKHWNGVSSSQSADWEDFHSLQVNLTFC